MNYNNVQELSAEINYFQITHDDMLNGEGLRVVLWVAGCLHQCKGCQNSYTWNQEGGIPLTQCEENEFWKWLGKSHTQGATFSGGDPLHPHNRVKVGQMVSTIKNPNGPYHDKDVWVYTGYHLIQTDNGFLLEDKNGITFSLPWLNQIDVLVDGRYEEDTRKEDLVANRKTLWRGSSNQRVIDVKQTIATGKITLWCK